MRWILLLVLLLLALGGTSPPCGLAPAHWQYWPTGVLGMLILLLLLALVAGRL